MKLHLIVFMSLLAVISLASAYTPEQQTVIEGMQISFQLGEAYLKAMEGADVAGFNALVDQHNAFVIKNFGNDTALLMKRMSGPVNLQTPWVTSNNTTANGITHTVDGSGKYGPQYTTNDINQMSNSAISGYQNSATGKATGDGYLGGV